MNDERPDSSAEDWSRIEAILDRAFELEGDERRAYLAEACGDDAGLRRRVEALLAADARGITFLDRGAAELIDDFESAVERPGAVHGYRIVDEIGRGGMSIVYRAERADGRFDKQVAVKVVRPTGMGSDELVRRFAVESRIVASLEHPHIARVLDAGATEGNDPYLVMELVDGLPITRFCVDERLTVDERLALFAQVCDAVHHAHQRLIVHRDLKPSNILVTAGEGGGFVKLLDFGIAKLLDQSDDDDVTRTGLFLMTPQYAAPEQIRGDAITTATDVYALGLVLYEMLVGEPPYRVEGRSPREIIDTVCDSEPDRPSTRVTEEATGTAPGESVSTLRSRLRGDLDAIVLKALEKQPERRYASVQALTADVDRFRRGLPVEAKPASGAYRARKFVRRHPLGVGVVVLLFVLIAGAAVRERLNADRIRAERDRADRLVTFLVEMFEDTDPAQTRGREITADELLARAVERVDADLEDQPLERARILGTIGTIYQNLGLLDDAVTLHRRSLDTFVGERDEMHDDVTRARMELGSALQLAGSVDEAEDQMRAAYDARRIALGATDGRTLESARGLALILEKKGEVEEAENLLDGALPVLEERVGPDGEATLSTHLALANVLHTAGKWDPAEEHYTAALEGYRRVHGEDHPFTMRAFNDLALLLMHTNRVEEAIERFEQLVLVGERVWGTEHHEAMTQKNNLAIAYYNAGRIEDASEVFTANYETYERTLGADHPATLNTLNNAAMTRLQSGDLDRAREMLIRARDGYAAALGDDHPQTITMIHNLGSVELRRGNSGQAREYLSAALEARRRILGPDHAFTVLSQLQLGQAYVEDERFERGRELLSEVVGLAEAAYAEGHATIGNAHLAHGRSLAGLGRDEEAEAELLAGWTILSEHAPPTRATAGEALVEFYEARGRADEAASIRARMDEDG